MNKLITVFQRHWPLITALIILWVTIILLLDISLKMNQGHFIYGLDDGLGEEEICLILLCIKYLENHLFYIWVL